MWSGTPKGLLRGLKHRLGIGSVEKIARFAPQRNSMGMYRKKPVVIEARQITPDTILDVYHWCGGEIGNRARAKQYWYIVINTLEGDHKANIGDFVIKGVQGEFYPCKPDIFALTYEEA